VALQVEHIKIEPIAGINLIEYTGDCLIVGINKAKALPS
jgi:hypothetical protein